LQISNNRLVISIKSGQIKIGEEGSLYRGFSKESLAKARIDANFIEVNLHIMPEGMYFRDFFIYHLNLQLSCLVKFFKEVFNDKSAHSGYEPSNKYYRLILSKTLYFEIMSFINDHLDRIFR
jgi:hypothetical protein